jgi:hypothetical protein
LGSQPLAIPGNNSKRSQLRQKHYYQMEMNPLSGKHTRALFTLVLGTSLLFTVKAQARSANPPEPATEQNGPCVVIWGHNLRTTNGLVRLPANSTLLDVVQAVEKFGGFELGMNALSVAVRSGSTKEAYRIDLRKVTLEKAKGWSFAGGTSIFVIDAPPTRKVPKK